jgi:hypothetical protein
MLVLRKDARKTSLSRKFNLRDVSLSYDHVEASSDLVFDDSSRSLPPPVLEGLNNLRPSADSFASPSLPYSPLTDSKQEQINNNPNECDQKQSEMKLLQSNSGNNVPDEKLQSNNIVHDFYGTSTLMMLFSTLYQMMAIRQQNVRLMMKGVNQNHQTRDRTLLIRHFDPRLNY